MAGNLPNLMDLEYDKLEQEATLSLFDVDLRSIGGTVYRFHSGLNKKYENVKWQGFVYEAFPSSLEGVDRTAQGASNRPTFVLSNLTGVITGLVEDYEELVGATVIQREVYAKFLDKENFQGNVNPYADPNQEFVSLFLVQRLTKLDDEFASFELCLPVEAEGAMIPSTTILCDSCNWQYRGEGCRYSGNRYFDRFGRPVGSRDLDECGKRESDCNVRFRPNNENISIPIRMFPSAKTTGN